jgi:hypothetical protein
MSGKMTRSGPPCKHGKLVQLQRWPAGKMPPRPRKKRHNATPSQRKEREAVPVLVQAEEPSQPQGEKHKSYLYIMLVIPILLLIALNSLVTFLYIRALDPLYGRAAVNLHLDKVVWAATIMGAFGPVTLLSSSLAVLGCLVASVPVSCYWTAVYTGRINDPALGSTVTHLVVLFPVIYFGVSLVKRITVCAHALHSDVHTALKAPRRNSIPTHQRIPLHALQSFQHVPQVLWVFKGSGMTCWSRIALYFLTIKS